MKSIVALHTVKSVYESFTESLRAALGETIIIDHIVDEYLANDPARHGGAFSKATLSRFYSVMMQADSTSPDLILVTCSTLSPHVDGCRAFVRAPVVAIDDALCESAIERGKRICVLATAASTLEPTMNKIRLLADRFGKDRFVQGFCDPEAIAALKRGDRNLHDAKLLELSRHAVGFDVIVLAQASMALMRSSVEQERGIPTLSSPDLCVAAVARMLEV